jgi:hypothetical protein
VYLGFVGAPQLPVAPIPLVRHDPAVSTRVHTRGGSIALVAVAAVALSACSSAPTLVHVRGGDYTPPHQRALNFSAPSTAGQPVSLAIPLYTCSTRDVAIDSVTLVRPSGLRLNAWGINNGHEDSLGNGRTLAKLGDYRSRRLTVRCKTSNHSVVGVEVERMGPGSASADGVAVHYRSGDTKKTLTLWFGIGLCGKEDPSAAEVLANDTSTHAQLIRACEDSE